jgi:hypothetical protein
VDVVKRLILREAGQRPSAKMEMCKSVMVFSSLKNAALLLSGNIRSQLQTGFTIFQNYLKEIEMLADCYLGELGRRAVSETRDMLIDTD